MRHPKHCELKKNCACACMCVCWVHKRKRKKNLQQQLILSGKKNPEDKNVIDEFTVHDYSSVYEFI